MATPSKSTKSDHKPMADRIWDVATKLMVPLAIVFSGALVNHESRLAVLEANFFSAREAAEMERRWIVESPAWLKEDLGEIKDLLRELRTRLRAVEQAKAK